MNQKRKWYFSRLSQCLCLNWVSRLVVCRGATFLWAKMGYGLCLLIFAVNSVGQNNTLSPAVYRQLQQVQALIVEAHYDDAIQKLEKLKARHHKRQNTDSAMIWQASGHVWAAQGQHSKAINAYEQALATQALPPALAEPLHQNLGQLYIVTGRASAGIRLLNDWLSQVDATEHAIAPGYPTVNPQVYAVLAQAYAQQGEFPKAIDAIDKALSLNRDTKNGNSLAWRRAKIAYLISAERYQAASKALEKQVSLQPEDRALWRQWWSIELMAGNASNALSILQLANEKQLLSAAEDFRRLSDLYLQEALPFEAAQTLQTAMADAALQETAPLWIRTAQLYYQARERDETSQALTAANRLAPSAAEARQIANLAATIDHWAIVKAATERQIKLISTAKKETNKTLNHKDAHRGPLSQAQYLLAIAYIKLKTPSAAKPLLNALKKHKKYGASARQWLSQLAEIPPS